MTIYHMEYVNGYFIFPRKLEKQQFQNRIQKDEDKREEFADSQACLREKKLIAFP